MRMIKIALVVVVVVAGAVVQGIRVYEGTNLRKPGTVTGTNATRAQTETIPRAESRSDANRRTDNNLLKYSKELKSTPDLYKVKLTQKGYLQFLRYLADIPPLREYTFCLWYSSNNLSHAQPLFSYAVQDKTRLLSLWYEPKDATIRKTIRDDVAFKVPALIREDRWYHICESWDGVHGEWSLFLDGAKIGSGQLQKYKGTYVPGGGEVVVGQEPADFHKGLDDGIEGEIFGFNLVDEAVKDDVIVLKHRQVPDKAPDPVVPTQYIPPFKALPPMKKSYQEIKAYITSLPSEPSRQYAPAYGARKPPKGPGPGLRPKAGPKPPRVVKPGGKHPPMPPPPPPRPHRMKQRPRYKPPPPPPPVRKAIVYDREDRHLKQDDAKLAKKMGKLPAGVNQVYDENYSIHSYRLPKEKLKSSGNYEIYEALDEDVDDEKKRTTRHNFNIYTAREAANNLYVRRARQERRPVFHFEVSARRRGRQDAGIRRSLNVVPDRVTPKTPPDAIPVHEVIEDDHPFFRRRRRSAPVDDLTESFRPLPKIPDGFADLLKGDISSDLTRFFTNRTEATTPSPLSSSSFSPVTERFDLPSPTTDRQFSMRNDVFDGPRSRPHIRRNMIVSIKDLERRPGITAGTELVKRGYEECGAERGSPVSDKDRLVVSWAETPVRIYGGAVVTAAINFCGHF